MILNSGLIKNITKKYKTPVLVISLKRIIDNYKKLKENVRNSSIYYAIKANSHYRILESLRDINSNFDAASKEEIKKLLKIKVLPERISFGNTIKKIEDIKYAYKKGINLFAIDSEQEIKKISDYAPHSEVFIRIEIDNVHADWPLNHKFGTTKENAKKLIIVAKQYNLKPIGISFHVGSQNYNPKSWFFAIKEASELFRFANENKIKFTLLNTGGGMPIEYSKSIPTIEAITSEINSALEKYIFPINPNTKIILEPGRSLVGNAGYMISKVILKRFNNNKIWIYLDIGIFHGLFEAKEGIKYKISVLNKENEEKTKVNLAGPTCDSVDIIYKDIDLPKSTDLNDLIIFHNAGAYTNEYSTNFNGFKGPKIIFEDDLK